MNCVLISNHSLELKNWTVDLFDPVNSSENMNLLNQSLLDDPFKQCNDAVPVGDRNGGPMKDCMVDVCQCYSEKVRAH